MSSFDSSIIWALFCFLLPSQEWIQTSSSTVTQPLFWLDRAPTVSSFLLQRLFSLFSAHHGELKWDILCFDAEDWERGERQRPMRRRDAYEHKRALMSLAHTRSLSSIHCRGLISFTTNLKKLKKVLKQNNNNAKKKFREETDRRRIDASRHKITQYWNIRKKRHLKRDTLLTQKFSEFYFSDAGRQSNERTACGGEIWILKEGLDWSRCICSRFQGTLQTGELT